MTPQQFIARWGHGGDAFDLNEEQGAQSHFLELYELLDVPKPGTADYHFEEKSALIGGKTGYADVFKRGCFAWENKAPGKNLDAYAAELARLTVWIGELQWRMAHGFEFKTNPVLDPLDQIECRDAQLTGGTEARWPKVDVVMGNPPFLGDRKMIRELGEDYTLTLRKVYEGRVPGGADLVTYWFEQARHAIETNGLMAAGLVTTNSIRGGANRKVLDAIAKTTRIYDAWSDEGWWLYGDSRPGLRKALSSIARFKLYNLRPAWLDTAHKALDVAVAHAYGWSDYSADMPDEEILQRLLVLNLERAV